jgi:hypothetical protein
VVSAQLYTRSVGKALVPLDQAFVDLGHVLVDNFHGPLLAFALIGIYAGLRRREACARLAALWGGVAVTVLIAKPLLGFDSRNPDSIAYVLAGIAAVAAACTAGLAAALSVIRRPARGLAAVWLAPALLVALALGRALPRSDLSAFHATEGFDDLRMRDVPARSVIVATTPQTVFRHLEMSAAEQLRPDVELVPLPFLDYPGFAEHLSRRHPDVAPFVEAFRARGRIDPVALAALSRRRPVLVELDPHMLGSAYRSISPEGLFYRFVGAPVANERLALAAARQKRMYERLARDLGPRLREGETARQWLYVHFFDALYYASHGATDSALAALAGAEALFPAEPELARLRDAVMAQPRGEPVAISAFLRRADTTW